MKACFDPLITSTCSRLYEYKQDVEKKKFFSNSYVYLQAFRKSITLLFVSLFFNFWYTGSMI